MAELLWRSSLLGSKEKKELLRGELGDDGCPAEKREIRDGRGQTQDPKRGGAPPAGPL